MRSSKTKEEGLKRKMMKQKRERENYKKQYSPQQRDKINLNLISDSFLTKKLSLGNNEKQ